MKRIIFLCLSSIISLTSKAQDLENQGVPTFPECEKVAYQETENCFYQQLETTVFTTFKIPEKAKETNYKGIINSVFEVDTTGVFKPLYINAETEELKKATETFFSNLPKIKPATYNGKKLQTQYTLRITIPLEQVQEKKQYNAINDSIINPDTELSEFEDVQKTYKKFSNPQFKTRLSIPFSHANYAMFDAYLNRVGANNHTAVKPYSYADVMKYYNFEEATTKLLRKTNSWAEKKLWNEHFVAIETDDYWFTLNPILDLRLGKDIDSEISYTYVNTRGVQVQGGLKNLTFSATIFESQGRFADYYNDYITTIKPTGGNPAIIPGIGIAKSFKTDSYDFPLAEANIKFSPSKLIDLQLGYGRNFIGDGYRSLLLSDGANPYPFFKINTKFWKIQYTNTYMWLKDVTADATVNGAYATKYMASHYLSYNISKRFTVGLFENVVWTNTNDRGFDMNFVNPIIFYRAVEFTSSSKSGNAVLGATAKYRFNNRINFYGQLIIDEFAIGDVKKANKSWRNKFGTQIGAKYYDAFGIKNLQLQLEYNQVRPYVYSHSSTITNYGHSNTNLGHQWGANFREITTIARYFKNRYFAQAQITFGERGLDYNIATNNYNYGGNIYLPYTDNRPYNTGIKIGQGNNTKVFITDVKLGYLVNPASNLKVFVNYMYRNFNPNTATGNIVKSNTSWFSVGLRTDVFNWYLDY